MPCGLCVPRVALRDAIVCCSSAPDADVRWSTASRMSSSTGPTHGSDGSQRCHTRGPIAVSAIAIKSTISRSTRIGKPVLPGSTSPDRGLNVDATEVATGTLGPDGPATSGAGLTLAGEELVPGDP